MDSVNTTVIQDDLIAGPFPLTGMSGTCSSLIHNTSSILSLSRGTVFGKNSGGVLALCDKDAIDGSEEPYGILAEDVDTESTNFTVPIYVKGEFNSSKLTFAAGTDADDIADAALARSIIIRDVAAQ